MHVDSSRDHHPGVGFNGLHAPWYNQVFSYLPEKAQSVREAPMRGGIKSDLTSVLIALSTDLHYVESTSVWSHPHHPPWEHHSFLNPKHEQIGNNEEKPGMGARMTPAIWETDTGITSSSSSVDLATEGAPSPPALENEAPVSKHSVHKAANSSFND